MSKFQARDAARHIFDFQTLRKVLQTLPRRTLAIWLLAIALGLVLLPLTLATAALLDQVRALDTDLQLAVAAQTTLPTLAPRVQALNQQLAHIQAQANQIKAVNPTLTAGNFAWGAVMSALGNYDANQIALDGLGRADGRLVLTGRAASDQAILAYVNALQQSGAFDSVVLQSVQIADSQAVTMTVAPASIAPTRTPTPTATLTPTPNLRDAYEPDEITAPYYYLGQIQNHTFFPGNDIDHVVFLAKAGRYYRVATQNLAVGVDTVLDIDVGGSSFSNDDAKPGSLYSEIIFAAPATDTLVSITITNRGQY